MLAIQSYTYKVRSYHTDSSGRLFVHQLLNFLQDAAQNHADGAGYGYKQLVDQDLFWVTSRLTIEILSMPKRGDEIKLFTWVKSIRGSISEREFSISLGEQVMINASSLWFCLSGQSHKPARLPSEFCDLMEINATYATTEGTEKVDEPDVDSNRSNGIDITARYSDIDMVDHVNNAIYARWMMDEVPVDYQQRNTIKKLSINYLGECFLGDKVKVFHTVIKQLNLLHEVVNSNGDKVICRIHSTWEEE
jgi:acyl-ACP thioesterase